MLPVITGEFGVVADPELRFSERGTGWAKIRGVAKDRKRDSAGNWTDGDPLFIDIIVSAGAEHLVESVVKGDTIVVTGRLQMREYEHNGERKTAFQISADAAGPSTRWAPAVTPKSQETRKPAAAQHEPVGDVADVPPF